MEQVEVIEFTAWRKCLTSKMFEKNSFEKSNNDLFPSIKLKKKRNKTLYIHNAVSECIVSIGYLTAYSAGYPAVS